MNDKIEDMVANADTKPHCMVLRTEGLVKRYGKRTVVNDVSINVRQGEIVGLLGPNGAGKTTSFYMTTGLIVPNDGHIYLDNKDITDFPVYKRARAGIGYLPQEASVFRKLSVEDNIMSVLEMTKLTRQQQSRSWRSLLPTSILARCARTLATSCRVANVDAPRLRVVWPSTLSSSCSTSRLPVSTRLPSRRYSMWCGD